MPFDIVGVMQPNFELMNRRHQIWVPAVLNAANRDYRYLGVLTRRKVSMEQASDEMTAMSNALAETFPTNNRGWTDGAARSARSSCESADSHAPSVAVRGGRTRAVTGLQQRCELAARSLGQPNS